MNKQTVEFLHLSLFFLCYLLIYKDFHANNFVAESQIYEVM